MQVFMHLFLNLFYICSMKELFETREELHAKVFELLKKYMKENSVFIEGINPKDYYISRRQYFYLQNIADGKTAPFIGKKSMDLLLKKLGCKLETQNIYKISAL